MSEAVYVELLSLTSGIVLLTAVLVLWRREHTDHRLSLIHI